MANFNQSHRNSLINPNGLHRHMGLWLGCRVVEGSNGHGWGSSVHVRVSLCKLWLLEVMLLFAYSKAARRKRDFPLPGTNQFTQDQKRTVYPGVALFTMVYMAISSIWSRNSFGCATLKLVRLGLVGISLLFFPCGCGGGGTSLDNILIYTHHTHQKGSRSNKTVNSRGRRENSRINNF